MKIAGCSLAVALLLAPAVGATEATSPVLKAVAEANAAKTPPERLRALIAARFALESIRRDTAAQTRDSSKKAVGALAADGITGEALLRRILATRVEMIRTTDAPAEHIWHESEAKAIAQSLAAAFDRSEGFIEIGRALASRNEAARARLFLHAALREAAAISDDRQKLTAAESIARLAVSLGGFMDRDLLAPVRMIGDPAARAGLLNRIARDAPATDMSTELHAAIAAPVEDDGRLGRIRAALDHAVETGAIAAAERAILSLPDVSEQSHELTEMLDGLAKKGAPMRALEIAKSLVDPAERAQQFRNLAVAFSKAGYRSIADGCFELALAAARTAGPALAAPVIRALASTKREDQALAEAEKLPAGPDRSYALAAVARRLADAGRIDEADALLPQLISDRDRSFALGGIWRSRAKGGAVEAAAAALELIADADDRDQVRAAIAVSLAKRRDHAAALETAAAITEIDARLSAILDVGLAASARAIPVARQAFTQAIALIQHAAPLQRGERLLRVIAAQATLGETEAAAAVVPLLTDPEHRSRASSEIAGAFARKKNFAEAYETLHRIAGTSAHDEALATVLLEEAKTSDDLKPIVERLAGITHAKERRAAFRALAEQTAARVSSAPRSGRAAAQPAAAASRTPIAFSSDGIEVSQIVGTSRPKEFKPPKTSVSTHSVRPQVPFPRNGRFGLGLLPDEPQFKRFGNEKLVPRDGRLVIATSLDPARKAQKLASSRYVNVAQGVVTIGEIAREYPELVERTGDVITIRVPINVAHGATLLMLGGDAKELRLSEQDGAFIMNGGRLFVVDTALIGWNLTSNKPAWRQGAKGSATFRPFISSWTGSDTVIAGSRLAALGYQMTKAFGLTITTGPQTGARIDKERQPTATIVDNTIENFDYGFYSYEARDTRVVGNEFRNNLIYGVDPHDRTHRLTVSYNTVYGSAGKHGIIISREVDDSRIIGNLIFANAGSGIMLERQSNGNVVYANTTFDNVQDGITIFETACNLIVRNDVFRNKRAGLKIRNSVDIGIYHNFIRQNAQRGIEAYIANLAASTESQGRDFALDPYTPITTFSAGWNIIARNAAAVSMSGVSGATFVQNSFRFAGRRLLVGDAEKAVASVLLAPGAMIASQCRPKRVEYSCPLKDQGLLSTELLPSFSEQDATNDCTAIPGTVQSIAFSAVKDGG